jgi:hypothetical protein
MPSIMSCLTPTSICVLAKESLLSGKMSTTALRTLWGMFLKLIIGLFLRKLAKSPQWLVTLSPDVWGRCDS